MPIALQGATELDGPLARTTAFHGNADIQPIDLSLGMHPKVLPVCDGNGGLWLSMRGQGRISNNPLGIGQSHLGDGLVGRSECKKRWQVRERIVRIFCIDAAKTQRSVINIGKQQPDLIGQRMAYLGDAQLRLGLQVCTLFLVVVQ